MRTPLAVALAAAFTLPLHADPAADYDRLRDALPISLLGTSLRQQIETQSQVIEQLEGRWVVASDYITEDAAFPDLERLKKGCEESGIDLRAGGIASFTLTMEGKVDYVIRLRWDGGTTYIATTDEPGVLAMKFGDTDLADVQPDRIYMALVLDEWSGYLMLNRIGQDLLLVQPLASPPKLLSRCP